MIDREIIDLNGKSTKLTYINNLRVINSLFVEGGGRASITNTRRFVSLVDG